MFSLIAIWELRSGTHADKPTMTEHNHRRGTVRGRYPVFKLMSDTVDAPGCVNHGKPFTYVDSAEKLHNGYRPRNGKTYGYIDKSLHGWGRISLLADTVVGASIGNDFTNGTRGMAKAVRGAKKFVRTRIRFRENARTRKLTLLHDGQD